MTRIACFGLVVLFSLSGLVRADQDETVLGKTRTQWLQLLKTAKQAKVRRAALIARAEAIESMVNNGSKVEEIEQVLQAFHSREAPRREDELHVIARN